MNELQLLNASLQALAPKLELLVPALLVDRQAGEIIRSRENMFRPAWQQEFPITIARFKECAAQEIYRSTRNRYNNSLVRLYADQPFSDDTDFIATTAKKFTKDVSKIHAVLFRKKWSGRSEVHAGLFTRQRSPDIHADNLRNGNSSVIYISRLGALPVQFISSKHFAENKELVIAAAKAAAKWEAYQTDYMTLSKNHNAEQSKSSFKDFIRTRRFLRDVNQEIVKRNILSSLPLSDVALMTTDHEVENGRRGTGKNYYDNAIGTPHRSSPTKIPGEHSAFFLFTADSA